MRLWYAWPAIWLMAGSVSVPTVGQVASLPGQTDLVKNPSFEEDRNARGVPDNWQTSGDGRLVTQTLSLDQGRDGKRCARLSCTRFERGNAASHAMLCQMGVPVRRGATYRVRFWARAEGIVGDVVSVALSDTSVWANCGLEDVFAPTAQWAQYESLFRATRDCPKASRFQIWFTSTGTLWVDDMEFVEVDPSQGLVRPGHVIPAAGHKNLIPNASFECFAEGWGSAAWDRAAHWGGPMNRLFGNIDRDTKARDGGASFKIEVSPQTQPVSFFDYYELCRAPIRAPLAANVGFIEIEPGKPYTFSAYMKAKEAGTPARLAVRFFQGGAASKLVRLTTDWQRYSLTFAPQTRWCYVLAGPDLCPGGDNPNPPQSGTVWLDALQLERGERASEFIPRSPIEFGITTGKPGNVFGLGEGIRFSVSCYSAEHHRLPVAKIDLRVEDFSGRDVMHKTFSPTENPSVNLDETEFLVEQDPLWKGFLRIHAKLTSGDENEERSIRIAVIPTYEQKDSRFGVNHAYPWPHLLDLSRKAGLLWVRDWSLKWQEVEPEKGRFNFAETDFQIDRPRAQGLQVLGLLPFPSSNWSSSAPASMSGRGPYPQNRARVAYAPRDAAEFENYVEKTVTHYKGRIAWWQCFNEPLYTDYALPRARGYDGGTLGRLTVAFARAARRADPQCRVLAGIGGIQEGQIMGDFEKFFAAGGLAAADAIDIHHYPTLRPPEFLEDLLAKLNALMDKHGGRKPIWITEYGYYAEDEPQSVPIRHTGFDRPLASERVQAEYAVRWATIALANGVDKVFYHAGTCPGINADNLEGVFYEYGGQPRKIYAAQAVMASFLTPSAKFVKKLSLGPAVRGYLFRDGQRLIAVVWSPNRTGVASIRVQQSKIAILDLMGRPQNSGEKIREFTPNGTPVYLTADGLSDEAFATALSASPPPATAGQASSATPKPPAKDRWEPAIRAFEAQDRKHPSIPGGIVFVGSSSIRLWKLAESFPGVEALNRGFGGSQLADSVRYADRIVIPYKPRLVVLYAGDNDLAAGKSPEQVSDDSHQFVAKVHAALPKTRILYIGIKPSLSRWKLIDKIRDANRRIKDFAATDPRLVFIDVEQSILGPDGKPRPELFQPDGLHLNATGYRVWAELVRPYLKLE
jgi:lysophospholipase L1-like esterase